MDRIERVQRAGQKAEDERLRRLYALRRAQWNYQDKTVPRYPRKRKESFWIKLAFELAIAVMCLTFGAILAVSVTR